MVWNNYSYASIRGLQRGYLGGRELATDFRHPETGEPYNPDFAALARACGIDSARIDRAGDLGDAIKIATASGKPYLIDANIAADLNPGGAGVWELPRHGVSQPFIGADTNLSSAQGDEFLPAVRKAWLILVFDHPDASRHTEGNERSDALCRLPVPTRGPSALHPFCYTPRALQKIFESDCDHFAARNSVHHHARVIGQ